MSVVAAPSPASVFLRELRKVAAFFRRDLLTAWSYRLAFFTSWLSLLVQVVLFNFMGQIVAVDKLPTYGSGLITYLEFVAVGIALTTFMQIALTRVQAALRGEQLMGTLESLLLTPTTSSTVQFGSVAYDLVFVPIRMGIFFALVALVFGASFSWSGLLPAMVIVMVFIPFVWGLGVASAASMLTFRTSRGVVGYGILALALTSGAFFPLEVFPSWAQDLARLNPLAIAVQGTREAMLGGTGWSGITGDLMRILPFSLATPLIGAFAFRGALRRERRKGTLGLY
jgi:ABC-2 type transport system permease protein